MPVRPSQNNSRSPMPTLIWWRQRNLLVGDSCFCAAPAPRDCPPSCFTALTTAATSPEFVVSGSVNGIPVDAIVIDTACTCTMVHRSLISEECLTGDHITTSIRCAHDDEMVYPLACITLAVGTASYFLAVVVSDTLPRTVLLGRDVPGIQTLLQTLPTGQADALQVTTRSHGPGKATPAAREIQRRPCSLLHSSHFIKTCSASHGSRDQGVITFLFWPLMSLTLS